MVAAVPGTAQGKRDRALLLVGFGGGFRRSELVALDRSDVRIRGERMEITVRASKTDQEGEGQVKHFDALRDVSVCPVAAMRAWLDAAGIRQGPVFVRSTGGARRARMTGQSGVVVKGGARCGPARRATCRVTRCG
jgi:integrase